MEMRHKLLVAALSVTILGSLSASAQNPGQIIVTTPTGNELIALQTAGPQSAAISVNNLGAFINTGGGGGTPGVFTTLSASGAVTGAGFTARFATPGPIGNTTASTGAFTTLTATTLNGNAFTTGTGTLTLGAGKTLTANNSLTLAGTDTTTMTFPTTSASIARTDAAQTFTGTQTFSGQILSTTGTPTIASGACGTTTNGAVVMGSTNQSGQITIGAAATTTCTISWSATITAPNACVFFPMNATAAATGTTVARVGAPTATNVVLSGSALANSNYAYMCL
jgi:hypothetical protein